MRAATTTRTASRTGRTCSTWSPCARGGIDAESLLAGTYDPYVFYRDAYRQRRLYLIYDGEPPLEAIQQMQGIEDEDIDDLLEQQRQYEKSRKQ